jgi:hypothetical protein
MQTGRLWLPPPLVEQKSKQGNPTPLQPNLLLILGFAHVSCSSNSERTACGDQQTATDDLVQWALLRIAFEFLASSRGVSLLKDGWPNSEAAWRPVKPRTREKAAWIGSVDAGPPLNSRTSGQ